jgi:hypothetical protein
MSNLQVNIKDTENQNEKMDEDNVGSQKNIDYLMKNINNNPLIQQFLQDNKLNSRQPPQVNFPVTNLANLDKDKLYDTFIVFQNFLEMVNYSSKNLDFMFHNKLSENQSVENLNKINSKSNEENLEARNSNYNQDDVVTYQMEKKMKSNDDDNKEEVEEINFNPELHYRERKNSARSERNTGTIYVEANTSRNQEDESNRIKTNDMKINFKKSQYDSERSPQKETIPTSATRLNYRNYDENHVKSDIPNYNEGAEKNLEIVKYEIIDDKSDYKLKNDRKVKKVQLKKNVELPKPTEYKR